MRRFHLFFTAPLLVVLAARVLPLVAGEETLVLRDVLHSHYPLKASQAEAWRAGDLLPLVDPYRSHGQPLLGNLNAVPLYPTNLLYLVASPLWALNAHFWLHLLLAPLAGFWLGRAWGLSRPAAWTVGATYAVCGFFLSLLNLYNLVAGGVLAPAFAAAAMDAAAPRARRGAAVVAGVLWALLLVAGDPLFAVLALLLGTSAAALRHRPPPRRLGALAVALAAGTALAAPQLVETARILPLSFRGHWRYAPEAALAQSWDPRTAVEWLLPLAFGGPDLDFWGQRFHGGNEAFVLSLHPGVAVLALVVVAGLGGRGRDARRAALWGWGAVAVGAFVALGVWNPVMVAAARAGGTALVRYPVKAWLLGAVGGALLAGIGMERALAGGRRRAVTALAALAVAYAAGAVLLGGAGLDLAGLDPRLAPGTPERARWATLAAVGAVLAAGHALLFAGLRRRPRSAALVLVLHAATQLFLLGPLLVSDDAAPYRAPPPLLAAVPADARVVHGGFRGVFGPPAGPLPELPERRLRWLERLYFRHLHPFAGIPWGRRYAYASSPEGLDSFYAVALERRLPTLDDASRIRLLAATGVDVLLLDRDLDPVARPLVRPLGGDVAFGRPVTAWGLPRVAPAVRLVGEAVRAPHLNAAVAALVHPAFDPRRAVVLPGEPRAEPARPPGTVRTLHADRDGVRLAVTSPAGGWVVVDRAWLALYRATVDGRDAEVEVADGLAMAVAVPAGEHEVTIAVDRRPTRAALALVAAGAVALAVLARRPRGRR